MRFEQIKGFGQKRIQKLCEAGITSPTDLLTVFPSKYVFRDSKINDFSVGEEAAIVAVCNTEPIVKFVRKGLSFVRATFVCFGQNVECVWFNQPYVKRQLVIGKTYALVGKLKRAGSKPEVYVSSLAAVEGDDRVIAIYKPYNGIPSKILKDAIAQILSCVRIEGQISDNFCEQNGILPFNCCIKTLHMPQNPMELDVARANAALQILAYNLTAYMLIKGLDAPKKANFYGDNVIALKNVINSLPYKLTADQQKSLQDILSDLHSDRKMNRLIEGDVGCGKTVVAFLAMYYAALSGYQAALMAPTEILARQHYTKAIEFFGNNIKCELLCSSQSKDRRAEALFNIASGNAQIVIGTHAIFQDAVTFRNLALTVIDEQHRFGVEQRSSFENKGESTDTLVMSATPIPRTLALTLYGDLDISVIKTLPESKAKIYSKFVPKNKEQDMFDYIYKMSLKGEKSYVVCPRVEDEDRISVTSTYNSLRKKYGDTVGIIHGQMKEEEKNRVMDAFVGGKCRILVCTTVIEVGIDVKDAVNIIIFDAETYGLSQLHQLRGRVGRGHKDSYCFVMSKSEALDKRLEYFIRTDSGFELAEFDFKVRGAGDFLGKRQHGNDSIFCGTSIDEHLLSRAKALSEKLLTSGEIDIENSSFEYIKGLTLN